MPILRSISPPSLAAAAAAVALFAGVAWAANPKGTLFDSIIVGGSTILGIGSGPGQVAAGNDPRLVGALQQAPGLPAGYVDLTAQASGVLPMANLPLDLLFNSTPLTGAPTLTGASPQMAFTRTGGGTSFVGATPSSVGFSSNETLPFCVQLGANFTPDLCVEPLYGNTGLGTTTPRAKLDVNGQAIILAQPYTPLSGTASCYQGQISWDAGNVWICTATNQWSYSKLTKAQ